MKKSAARATRYEGPCAHPDILKPGLFLVYGSQQQQLEAHRNKGAGLKDHLLPFSVEVWAPTGVGAGQVASRVHG